MSEASSGFVVLERGSKIICRNPSVDDVFSLMEVISAGPERGGAPEASLDYFEAESSKQKPKFNLLLLPTISGSSPITWLVHFMIRGSRGSTLLANRFPQSDLFETRTCVGTVMQYRRECLLKISDPCIRKAIEWYLSHFSRSPELTWIEYFDCVRD